MTDLKVIRRYGQTDRQTHESVRDAMRSLFITEREEKATKMASAKFKWSANLTTLHMYFI